MYLNTKTEPKSSSTPDMHTDAYADAHSDARCYSIGYYDKASKKRANEQLSQIILKSKHKCRSYDLDKLRLWPFYHLTFKWDLNLQPTCANVSNGTSTPQGEQLCHIILKSMHKYRCYGLSMLRLWRGLDLQSMCKNVSNGTSPPQIILKSMHKCRSYGPNKSGGTDGCTHALMHSLTHTHTRNKNCNSYVSLYRKRAWQKSTNNSVLTATLTISKSMRPKT